MKTLPAIGLMFVVLFSSDIKLLTILLRHLDTEQSQLLQSVQSLWRNLSFMVDTLGVHWNTRTGLRIQHWNTVWRSIRIELHFESESCIRTAVSSLSLTLFSEEFLYRSNKRVDLLQLFISNLWIGEALCLEERHTIRIRYLVDLSFWAIMTS